MESFPAFQRNSPSRTNSTEKGQLAHEVEDQLIDIGGWAIQSVKISGFFPLHISNNANTLSPITGTPIKALKPIQMRRLSIYSAHLGLLNFLGLFFIFYVFGVAYKAITLIQASSSRTGTDKKSATQNSFSDEEDNFIATYNGMAMVLVSAILRFKYLMSPKKSLDFWKQFVNLLKGFNDLDIFQPESNHVERAKSRVKKFSTIFLIITLVQTLVMFFYVYRLYHNSLSGKGTARGRYLYDDPNKAVSIFFVTCSLILILFVHLQVGFFIFLGFIIETYTSCFTAIGDAVQFEVSRKNGETRNKNRWQSVWSKSQIEQEQKQNQEKESRLSNLLSLFEKVCESTEEFNRFYTLPMMIDVFVCITNSFASIYAINKILYMYGVQHDSGTGGGSESSWDHILDLLHRLPSHWAFTLRVVWLSLAGNRITQESLKVVQLLQHAMPKCKGLLNDFPLQSQVQMLVTRTSIKPPGISPGNFFTLSNAFIVSLLSVLVTYFFILTEFREKSEGWNSIRKLNLSCHL